MNLIRCNNGHFYDKDIYPTCPHCQGGTANDESLTAAFTEDATVPMTSAPTVAQVAAPSPAAAAAAFVQPAPVPAPQPVAPGLPIADISADALTVPMDGVEGEDLTVPLFPNGPVDVSEPEDDDHTVGFFDFGTPDTGSATEAVASVAKPVNKVSTPCVGWLVALGGVHVGTDFRLKVGKNFIGRSAAMDVALTEDKSVSRDKQATVVYEPKEHLYLVQPGEASTLVYKNNEVVLTPTKLEAYDVITVGEVNLVFIPLCNKDFNWTDVLNKKTES